MNRHKANKKSRKKVLITGATSGIGKEITVRFAKERWDVLCHYFSAGKEIKGLESMVNKYKVNCYFFKADFSSERQLRRFIDNIGRFDIDSLINNAGTYMISRHFSELSTYDILNTFMVNSFAPMLLSGGVFMRMKKKRFGRIVNISSIAAKYGGSSYSMHYGCSKLALEGLTKTLAKEGSKYNVLVNTVRPGVIDTKFHEKFPKDMKKRIGMIPLRKMGTPGDVAEIVYYLGSDKNSFITDEVIAIAGGE